MSVQYKAFENMTGKGEIARNEQFLLFLQCFLPIYENFLQFSSNLKLLSANSFSLEESKIRHLEISSPFTKQSTVSPMLIKTAFENILGKQDKRAMMALERSPESFSPQMNSTSLFLWFPTCDPWGGDSFDSKGHHVNKIDKGLQ